MKPVHFRKSQKLSIAKALVSFLLAIVLVACGTSAGPAPSSSGQPPHGSTTSAPPSTPSNPDTSLHLNAENISVQQGDLLIQSKGGFQCPGTKILSSRTIKGQLVLASDRTTYSRDEIAQMRAYAAGDQFILAQGATPPSTLRWVMGGSMSAIPGTRPDPEGIKSGCEAVLFLTNTGKAPIQVPKIAVQLETRPQPNVYHYRLIDVCSVIPPADLSGECPPPGGGGPGACSVYDASIQLGLGEKNDVFSAVPGATGCNTLTVAPGTEVDLDIRFSLATNTPQNLIYSVEPIFTVDTGQGDQSLLLPQLVSTFAFASANQFSCYTLQGTTFVQMTSPVFNRQWCL
jgi:hypothetical protein